MKKFFTLLLLLVLFTASIYSQNVGDYQSFQSGNWNDVNTWSRWDGTQWVNPAPSAPTTALPSNVIHILGGHTVTVNVNITVDSVYVDSLGTVNINSGDTVFVQNTSTTTTGTNSLTINGTMTVNGVIKDTLLAGSTAGYGGTVTSGTNHILTFANGATYWHARDGGSIPTSTWDSTSTCLITGVVSTAPSNANQNFYNFTWDCPNQGSSVNLGWSGNTIGGTITCNNTKTSQFRWTNNNANGGNPITITIKGDVIVNNAAIMSPTSSGAALVYTINQSGNIYANGTSQLYVCGTSNTGAYVTWNVNGNISAASGALLKSSNSISRWKFNSGRNQTMDIGAPGVISSNVIFEVANGTTVQLTSPVTINRLVLTSGKIVSTATNLLTIGSTNSITGESSTAYVEGPMAHQCNTTGAQSFVYPIAKGGIYRPLTLSLTQSAATLSTYTAEMFNVAPTANNFPSTLDKVSTIRNYVISEGSGGSAFTAGAVTLSYDADDGVTDMANLRVAQGPAAGGGTWVDLGGTGSANTTGTILSTNAFTDLTTNTVFTLADNSGGSNVLPVELNSFSASINSVGVELTWSTATEVNNAGFEVQKMVNGSWTDLDFVSGDGNSNSAKSYSYIDKGALYGTYQYRLKQIDNDGTYKFSQVVEVNSLDQPLSYKIGNYPNPFNPATTIRFELPENTFVSISVYNMLGQKVATIVNQKMEKGIHEYSFNASSLASGVYIYQLNAGSKVLTQKMLLLK